MEESGKQKKAERDYENKKKKRTEKKARKVQKAKSSQQADYNRSIVREKHGHISYPKNRAIERLMNMSVLKGKYGTIASQVIAGKRPIEMDISTAMKAVEEWSQTVNTRTHKNSHLKELWPTPDFDDVVGFRPLHGHEEYLNDKFQRQVVKIGPPNAQSDDEGHTLKERAMKLGFRPKKGEEAAYVKWNPEALIFHLERYTGAMYFNGSLKEDAPVCVNTVPPGALPRRKQTPTSPTEFPPPRRTRSCPPCYPYWENCLFKHDYCSEPDLSIEKL